MARYYVKDRQLCAGMRYQVRRFIRKLREQQGDEAQALAHQAALPLLQFLQLAGTDEEEDPDEEP